LLRRFAPRNDVELKIRTRNPAAHCARGLHEHCPMKIRGRKECRMRAAPAVSCAKMHKENAHEHTGSAEAIRHSLRNGFTAYAALSSATNSSCHRRRRIEWRSKPGWADIASADLTPATGARTTRFCRPRLSPFVCALLVAHGRPAPPPRSRARRCRVHRIPPQRS
jgi:hypothetical protein